MNKTILFLVVLAACGGNPDAAMNEMSDAPNGRVDNIGDPADAGISTSIDYLDGRDGRDGAPGPQGPQGPEGAVGPQGIAGPQGSDGVAGPQGPEGVAGPQGIAGPQGPDGAPGAQGIEGAHGAGGYWVGSDGARAPIVSVGGTTLYVDPQGFMYKANPMSGHIEVGVTLPGVATSRYYEFGDCTGRSWYAFPETHPIAPMVTFNARGGAYAFSRDARVSYDSEHRDADFPEHPLGVRVYRNTSTSECTAVDPTWWPVVITVGNSKQYNYYVESRYVIAAPEPDTVVKAAPPPYRFVPSL